MIGASIYRFYLYLSGLKHACKGAIPINHLPQHVLLLLSRAYTAQVLQDCLPLDDGLLQIVQLLQKLASKPGLYLKAAGKGRFGTNMVKSNL